jgi:membrane fusion protein (multidrug efflux system)
MASKKKLVLLPLGALGLAAGVLFALDRSGKVPLAWLPGSAAAEEGKGEETKGDEKEEVPVPVELARAESRAISAYYRASSVVEADREVQLVSKTTGRVHHIAVEEGDWVKEGAILAELENDRERIQLKQAELREADQKRELDRRTTLLDQNLVTREEFAATKSAYEQSSAERELAAIRYEDTHIRAPFDGQVTDRRIVPGQHLNVSEPMFTLVDFEPLRVRIHLPEAVARRVTPGQEVQLDVEAHEVPVPAVVERVAPVVDPGTSTVRLTLLVRGRQQDLRVGGFVKARIVTETQMEALSIPKIALVEEGGLRSVFLAEVDSVRKVEIRTGLADDTHVEILDGLDAGAWVVSLGQGGLRTGSKIEVLNATQVGWVAPTPDSVRTATDEKKKSKEDEGAAVASSDAEAAG